MYICPSYKNGSCARERVRDMCVMADVASPDQKWKKFNELLDSTPPGNNGQIGNTDILLKLYTQT